MNLASSIKLPMILKTDSLTLDDVGLNASCFAAAFCAFLKFIFLPFRLPAEILMIHDTRYMNAITVLFLSCVLHHASVSSMGGLTIFDEITGWFFVETFLPLISSLPSEKSLTASGYILCSKLSMRSERVSSVSSGSTGTAAWIITGPVSMPS